MYKYENISYQQKLSYKWEKNKKPTEVSFRPTAEQLQTEDSISLVTYFVIGLFLVLAIGGEHIVRVFA